MGCGRADAAGATHVDVGAITVEDVVVVKVRKVVFGFTTDASCDGKRCVVKFDRFGLLLIFSIDSLASFCTIRCLSR